MSKNKNLKHDAKSAAASVPASSRNASLPSDPSKLPPRTSSLYIALLLLVLIAAFIISWLCLSPHASSGSKSITVNIHHLVGEDHSYSISTDAAFLRAALEAEGLISGTESTYGLWLESVDGETANSSLQQWWGFNVNGGFAVYGVDVQPVSDGDVYDFSLNVGY